MFSRGVVASYKKIVMKGGYTDLRGGIEMLSMMLSTFYGANMPEEDVLYVFCGRTAKKVKGLIRQKDGIMLINLQLYANRVHWIRRTDDLIEITEEQLTKVLNGEPIEVS